MTGSKNSRHLIERIRRIPCFNREQIVAIFVGQFCLTFLCVVYLNGQQARIPVHKQVIQTDQTHVTLKHKPEVNKSRDNVTHHNAPRVKIYVNTTKESYIATNSSEYGIASKTPPTEECFSNESISKDTTTYDFIVSRTDLENMFHAKRLVRTVSCKDILDNDGNTIVDTQLLMEKTIRKGVSDSEYVKLANNCTDFIKRRGYFTSAITKTEVEFPLAFSIVFYTAVEQFERLLRAIYRPQNVYCVHVDVKTSKEDRDAVRAIVSCFPNVFMSTRSVDVQWGEFSVLEAELICMKDLWAYEHWKYFINLTGQEFPLKTNLELVNILETMKWANVVDGTWIRARQFYFNRWLNSKESPPHNIRPIKGSVHVAINRDFVNFALHDYRSKDFQKWLNKTMIPDETFFSSLNHNQHLHIPGSFLGEAEEYPKKPTFTRYKNWELGHGIWVRKCSGRYARNVCVIGIGDLHRLKDDIGLFVNKFHKDFEYLALDCLEELMYNRTRDQYLNQENLDMSFYASLDQVRLRYIKPKDKN